MFAHQHTAQLRESFEHHFEPDGDGFLYRANPRAAPIAITAEERQRFIDRYARDVKRGYYIFMAAQLPIWGLFVGLMIYADDTAATVALVGGLVIACVGFVFVLLDVRRAPAKALSGRTPASPERTREEAVRASLAQVGWSQLGAAAVAGSMMPAIWWMKYGPLEGWETLWYAAGAALVTFAAVQAFRKWRIG